MSTSATTFSNVFSAVSCFSIFLAITFSVVGSVINGQYLVLDSWLFLCWFGCISGSFRRQYAPLVSFGPSTGLLLAIAPFTASVLSRPSPSRKLFATRHSSLRFLIPLLLCVIGLFRPLSLRYFVIVVLGFVSAVSDSTPFCSSICALCPA